MKKKIILVGLTAVLATTTVVSGSLAYFSAEGSKVQQQINTMTLAVDLQDVILDTEGKECGIEPAEGVLAVENVMPGQVISKVMRVHNSEEVTEYVRVSVRKYWTKTGAFSADSKKAIELDAQSIIIEPVNTEADKRERWIVVKETDEHIILYYTKPLVRGESTKNFMEQVEISDKLKNEYADKGIALEFRTDGVQMFAAEDAFVSEWGVVPVLDADGYILEIKE